MIRLRRGHDVNPASGVSALLQKLVPKLQVNSIYHIDLNMLWDNGYRGIITYLENTLVGARAPLATPELLEWLKKVRDIGFQVVIVSNNRRVRVEKFAEPLAIPYLYRAKKPSVAPFRKALALMRLSPRETVVIGDQMLTDVLGGNRMGLFTILVQPISREDESFITKINRGLEKVALGLMKK
jgi:hypothetical protein